MLREIGAREYGMLLSEKDSVVYPRCLAPELRDLDFPNNVHRVADYMGVGQEEKLERIAEIIDLAEANGYTHIFAGYGFMAEDADFISAIEDFGRPVHRALLRSHAARGREGRSQEARPWTRQRRRSGHGRTFRPRALSSNKLDLKRRSRQSGQEA